MQGEVPRAALGAEFVPRIRQLIGDYRAVDAHIAAALALYPGVAADLEEFASESERVADLDDGMRELIDMRNESACRVEALSSVQASLSSDAPVSDAVGVYEEALSEHAQLRMRKTTRQRYASDTHYVEFRSCVWEVNEEGPMPPLVDLIPAEPGDEAGDTASDEEDIVMGGTVQQFRCPLTASLLRDPVMSIVCAHVYSRAAILGYLRDAAASRTAAKCPAAACNATIADKDLKEAPSLQRRVDRYERVQARREMRRRDAHQGAVALE
ncbi:hypothetical protein MSPP1_002329 [Malassezia sp. CBS 17886]|nr:hypothetical protein MSPP1_002329 [Malassezia sp. CBS 17886]